MALVFESTQLEILLATMGVLSLLYLYLTSNFDYWKKKGVPYVKPMPFFGNIFDVALGRMSDTFLFKNVYDKYQNEKFVGIFQFRDPTLILRDPELIKDALVKNFNSFHDRGMPVDEDGHPLSAHLFNLPGTRWRALRAKLTPTFTSGKMKMMYSLMEECSEELRRFLKEPALQEKELEWREMMAQFTTDIIGSCAFGLQMNSMKDSDAEFRRMGRKVFESSFTASLRRLTMLFLPPIAKLFNFSFSGHDVDQFFINAVKETISYRKKNNITRNDFMQLLIQLQKNGKLEDDNKLGNGECSSTDNFQINLTDNLLAAQAFVFFLAGFETSSTLMSFALYELALNVDIQDRLRQEVDDVLRAHNGKLSYEALQSMQLMDKVVSESLRKYSPAGSLVRECTKPYTIPETNIVLEKGTRIVIPVIALHHDQKHYPDPERFDPERFSEEVKASRHHFAYLPFGEGPRNCIGMRFGLLQAKLGLATLLRDFQFSPSRHTVVPLRYDPVSLVTASKDGIHLKIGVRD